MSTSPSGPQLRPSEPAASLWKRWRVIWHAVFYGTLVLANAIALITGNFAGSPWIASALCALLGAWYWLLLIRGEDRWRRQMRWVAVYLAGGLAAWCLLAGLHPAYYLVVSIFFGQMWMLLPFGWAVGGNILLTLLIILRQALESGRLASMLGWPLFVAIFAVAWAVLLGAFVRSIIAQSEGQRRLLEQLEAAQSGLAAAQHKAGVLEERQRLAREIHDTLAQGFTSIILHLEAAELALPEDRTKLERHLDQAQRTARESLAEARRLVWALQPPHLDRSLADTLAQLVARWAEESGVPAAATYTGTPHPLPTEVEVTLLRATQEALANVRKHACAREVTLTLSYMDDTVALDVQDDGVGFDPETAVVPQEGGAGFGLRAMSERVTQLGGKLSIESAPGEGTTVALEIPVAAVGEA